MLIFLLVVQFIEGFGQSYYPTPPPSTDDVRPSLTNSIMSGTFQYRPDTGDSQVWMEYMKVWGVSLPENQESLSYGATLRLSPDGGGVDIDYEGQWTLPLRFGQEVTTTEPALGKQMKSFSWRTGQNTLKVINRVEEDGISETKSLVFYPHGLQVFSTVRRPAEDMEATLYEWLVRVDLQGRPVTLYIR